MYFLHKTGSRTGVGNNYTEMTCIAILFQAKAPFTKDSKVEDAIKYLEGMKRGDGNEID